MMRELKTFLAVVRHGTFARAATQIGLTQSAVSAQIQRLEADLGFALFERTGRSARLNEAGRRTVDVAESLLGMYATLADQGSRAADGGVLRLGAIASVQASLLVEAIALFRERAPGWRLNIGPGVSLNLLSQVDNGDLDAAVIVRPPFGLPSELRWRALVSEPFVVLAPRQWAERSWQDLLRSEPFIRYDRHSYGGRLVERFLKRQRIAVREVVELDELQGIVGLVASSVGVALLPLAAALTLPPAVRALELGEDAFHREVGLVERSGAPRPPAADTLLACIRRAAGGADPAP